MRHIIPISGKDSLTTAIIQKAKEPHLDYEYIYNATAAELPEVRNWLKKVEAALSIEIDIIGADLNEIVKDMGFLPSGQKRYCTRLTKIEPMEKYIGSKKSIIYYGLRYDEPERIGYQSNDGTITAVYPLRDARVNLPMVWVILSKIGIMPPLFLWEELYKNVKTRLGGLSYILEELSPWEKYPLFAWRTRPNCYYCFNQRQYEYIGLYKHHPDLFWAAVKLEEGTGAEGYTLQPGYSLRSLVPRSDRIMARREKKIVKLLIDKMKRGRPSLFGDEMTKGNYGEIQYNGDVLAMIEEMETVDNDFVDYLGITSCGLLCGK